jgi:hypothetical protein
VVEAGGRISLFFNGQSHDFHRGRPLAGRRHDHDGGHAVIAPMPGLVSALRTHAGAQVTKGTPLVVLEAMKMEHILTAPRDGTRGRGAGGRQAIRSATARCWCGWRRKMPETVTLYEMGPRDGLQNEPA